MKCSTFPLRPATLSARVHDKGQATYVIVTHRLLPVNLLVLGASSCPISSWFVQHCFAASTAQWRILQSVSSSLTPVCVEIATTRHDLLVCAAATHCFKMTDRCHPKWRRTSVTCQSRVPCRNDGIPISPTASVSAPQE